MNSSSNSSSSVSNQPIRFGMIGAGALGLVHTRRLADLPNIQIAAVSDPDSAATQRAADALPEPARVAKFTDYREMLDQTPLDAVCISSPNPWHVEQILAALDHDLHVLCEKPLSMIPEDVERVITATERSGKTVAIAYQSRYRRDSQILRRELQSGKWGRITSVDIFACEDWVTPNIGTWRHDPERCPGGYFADANGHQLDLLFWLTDRTPIDVRATIETRGTPVPIVTWGECRLAPQATSGGGNVEHSCPFTFTFVGDARQWREEISIQTEKADFVLRNTHLMWTDGRTELQNFSADAAEGTQPAPLDTPDAAFVAALRGGPPIVSEPHTVWPVLHFTLAALASAGR